ncbi:SH3 domain-containing protein [Penicillium diatomitis]|uniref:SH3 domain-containing protein n=1 Tax=Penicillium diatomitis TaxID=2819901 RepID=A0A9W9XGZ2_9EURO|nr:SH3 domain-containing protein [Penicillium diatomitis]KAJ5492852.1 SH3 domain-containing protein [Penicillium diatomitis]
MSSTTQAAASSQEPAPSETAPADATTTTLPSSMPTSSDSRQTPIAGRRVPIHNPFPASLASECKKAGQIIDSFVNPQYAGLEGTIPQRILGPAKGLVICSVFKAGFLGSVRFGSGLIICRLPNGNWSAPSAISLGGLGAGGQFGMEFTNFIFVLNTDAAVETFINSGTLTLGGNISIAFGTGRSAETAAMIGTKGISNIFAYSKTRGIYGGLTFEGGIITERSSTNKTLYKRKVKAKDLLSGEIPPPPQAEPLMRILNSECFRPPSTTANVPPAVPSGAAPVPEEAGGSSSAGVVEQLVEPVPHGEGHELGASHSSDIAEQHAPPANREDGTTAGDGAEVQKSSIPVPVPNQGTEASRSTVAAEQVGPVGTETRQLPVSDPKLSTDVPRSEQPVENSCPSVEQVHDPGNNTSEVQQPALPAEGTEPPQEPQGSLEETEQVWSTAEREDKATASGDEPSREKP